jgi:hypothetical protein
MKVASICTALVLTAVTAAYAQPVSGFYVQGSAGLALPEQPPVTLPTGTPGTTDTSAAGIADATINDKPGAAESGSGGWGLGDGLRMEIEGLHTAQATARRTDRGPALKWAVAILRHFIFGDLPLPMPRRA